MTKAERAQRKAMFNANRYDALFERGIAVGQSDIVCDLVRFVWREERFAIPSFKLNGLLKWNGTFYEAPVSKLRKVK